MVKKNSDSDYLLQRNRETRKEECWLLILGRLAFVGWKSAASTSLRHNNLKSYSSKIKGDTLQKNLSSPCKIGENKFYQDIPGIIEKSN